MKKNTLVVIFFFSMLFCKAQFIAPEIIEKHSPSNISKIYEITLNTLIDHSTQIKLANILNEKDSVMVLALKNNSSLKVINETLNSYQRKFEDQFSPVDKEKYLRYVHKSFIEADARIHTSYLTTKYSFNEELSKIFFNLYFNKNVAIINEIANKNDSSILSEAAFKALKNFDTIHSGQLTALQGQGYFNETVSKLNKVKPFSEKQMSMLRDEYRTQCFRKGDDFHNNFTVALRKITSDTQYYVELYQDSVNDLVQKQSKIELNEYLYKYNLQSADLLAIKPIIEEKVQNNIWTDIRFSFSRIRDSLQKDINQTSWFKIKNKLIRSGYTSLGTSRFSNVLRHKKSLNLSNKQLDSIADLDLEFDLMTFTFVTKNNGATPNYSQFERVLLKKYLREGQFDTLINFESMMQATANAKRDWNEIMKYKLMSESDSGSVTKSLVTYYKNYLVLVERYFLEPDKYKKLIDIAVKNRPQILNSLENAQVNDNYINDSRL